MQNVSSQQAGGVVERRRRKERGSANSTHECAFLPLMCHATTCVRVPHHFDHYHYDNSERETAHRVHDEY